MAPHTSATLWESSPVPDELVDIPILYEDEEDSDMGEVNLHFLNDGILYFCLSAHCREHRPSCQVFGNMNLYYLDGPPHPVTGSAPYVSPDTMIVEPFQPLPVDTRSYKIGTDGPSPLATFEVLSARSAQQRDLDEKVIVYRKLKVAEYFLIDETGKHLAGRLLKKSLGPDGAYHDVQDPDGGVTSVLGFRLVFEPDGLRVVDARSGYRYVRPMEAEAAAKARRFAEEQRRLVEEQRRLTEQQLLASEARVRALEEELKRLRESAGG